MIKIKDNNGDTLLDGIRKEEYICQFSSDKSLSKDDVLNLKSVDKLKFDIDNRFIIGYGGRAFIMVRLDTGDAKVYTVDNQYKTILDLMFKSREDNDMEQDQHICYLGCLMGDGKNMIKLLQYNFLKEANQQRRQ